MSGWLRGALGGGVFAVGLTTSTSELIGSAGGLFATALVAIFVGVLCGPVASEPARPYLSNRTRGAIVGVAMAAVIALLQDVRPVWLCCDRDQPWYLEHFTSTWLATLPWFVLSGVALGEVADAVTGAARGVLVIGSLSLTLFQLPLTPELASYTVGVGLCFGPVLVIVCTAPAPTTGRDADP